MADAKTEAFQEYLKIASDPEYKKSLGLKTVESVKNHLRVTWKTYYKFKEKALRGNEPDLSTEDKEYTEFLKKIRQHGLSGKNANYARLWAQLQGKLDGSTKGEDKNEPSPSDYIAIAREVVRSLQREFREGNGSCPVCYFNQTLRHDSCLDSERKHAADSEVETLAVPS